MIFKLDPLKIEVLITYRVNNYGISFIFRVEQRIATFSLLPASRYSGLPDFLNPLTTPEF